MLHKALLPLCILFVSTIVQSQNTIYSYTFDSNTDAWETQSLANSGNWSWASNGKADQGTYWNDRPSIDETSNGALVYDGDYIINSNQGDTSLTYSTGILSPSMDFSAHSEVFIKFNQYYRNYDSETSLQISSDLGNTWNTIVLNEGVNANVETSPNDYEIIDISNFAANEPDVNVRFLFEGKYYFWILDDVFFYGEYPVIPTIPSNIGEYLTLHGYPYEVDDAGWPIIPNEAIINFVPGTPESVKDQLREEVGAIKKEDCVCNTLETWLFVDSLLEGGIGLSCHGPTTGADEQVSTSTSASEIDDIDFNKYVKGELTEGSFNQPTIADILNAHQPPKGKKKIKIGIIDTGIDILHRRLKSCLFLSQEIPNNEIDDDENCYADNYVGWNFVDDNNNASDDHGHGTHVAGIVEKYTRQNKKSKVQIIPYKTHDFRGLANLFDVTCAMYQSIKDEVSVVNCSWGFYGNESNVLKTAILQAWENNITVVAASGNDSIYLVELQQYPACYKLPNVISVGSYNIDGKGETVINSYFSNYSAKFVDVLAPGVKILSTVPYNDYDYKTGTSMAAPAVAGLAALKYVSGHTDPVDIKSEILYEAQDHDHLIFEVLDGNVLLDPSYGIEIITTIENGFNKKSLSNSSSKREDESLNKNDVTLLRDEHQISLIFNENYGGVKMYLMSSQGQIIVHRDLRNVKIGWRENIDTDFLPTGLYYLRINEKVHEIVIY